MNQNKRAIALNNIMGIIQIIAGSFFSILFGLPSLVDIFSDVAVFDNGIALIVTSIITILSCYLVICGLKKRKLLNLFKDYILRLSTDPTQSVDKLAASTGTPIELVKSNLNQMIKSGYFPNAYIDESTNCITTTHN